MFQESVLGLWYNVSQIWNLYPNLLGDIKVYLPLFWDIFSY